MAIATVRDLETSLLRELSEAEEHYAPLLLDRAERLILARIPDLYRLTHGPGSGRYAQVVADVTAESVARVLRAPGSGIYSREAEGEYSYSINMQVASGLLDILDSEWDRLGVSPYGSIVPSTDGYLSRHVPHPWSFQYGGIGEGEGMAERWC